MTRIRTSNRRRKRRLQSEAWRKGGISSAAFDIHHERYGVEWCRFKHRNLYQAAHRRRWAERGVIIIDDPHAGDPS